MTIKLADAPSVGGMGCLDPVTGLVMGVDPTWTEASEAKAPEALESRWASARLRNCLVFGFEDDSELAEVRELVTKVSRPQ